VWKDESHDKEITPGRTTMRRYRKREKDQAVRLMFEICTALGTSQGTVIRIAHQLRCGTESLRRGLPRLRSMPGM
jgi:transposase-like protein